MVQIIRVKPVDGGWAVQCEGVAEPSLYLSGGRAETIARETAQRLATTGVDVQVDVEDREHRKAGSYWFAGQIEAQRS